MSTGHQGDYGNTIMQKTGVLPWFDRVAMDLTMRCKPHVYTDDVSDAAVI
jgi:hypothetical protein